MKPEPLETLVDALLAEQRTLTAVEKFGRLHDRQRSPLLEPHYRDLIPLSAPRPGEQYSFEVDLDRCSGCKGCVTACHSLNGLDDGEAWRDVGMLFGEMLVPEARGGNRVVPLQQTVTTACHHCVEPACLLGCPVLAYDKDPATGIVRHLNDQCIGCSYCVMQCPYEVPKYSTRRGIVRKCDMCHDRLVVGEAPACVQACPGEAIRITVVERESVRDEYRRSSRREQALISNGSRADAFLPDAPDPSLTLPTTRYVSTKSQPAAQLLAADHFSCRAAAAHWPLVWMLVLTQAGIGGWLAALWSGQVSDVNRVPRLAIVSVALFISGLVASLFHLGQPAKAWRVWLGWRTSWLSREAIALNGFAGIGIFCVAVGPATLSDWRFSSINLLPAFAGLLALVALVAQAMVYADTRRRFWRFASTFPRFLGTVTVLGLALKLNFTPDSLTASALMIVTLVKVAVEISVLKQGDSDADRWTQLRRTAALQCGPLRRVLGVRLILALAGGVLIPFGLAVDALTPGWAAASGVLCCAGEILERYLFFASVAPDKMPGQP
jgi:Fe-S-cluster-containing dehydrogenase component/DMSO reductase anchor subunit